jgi:hypothetical protein
MCARKREELDAVQLGTSARCSPRSQPLLSRLLSFNKMLSLPCKVAEACLLISPSRCYPSAQPSSALLSPASRNLLRRPEPNRGSPSPCERLRSDQRQSTCRYLSAPNTEPLVGIKSATSVKTITPTNVQFLFSMLARTCQVDKTTRLLDPAYLYTPTAFIHVEYSFLC